MFKKNELVPVVLVSNEEFWLPYTLEATRGRFERYVIYDVGSEDRTRDILTHFMNSCPGVDFRYRALPMCETSIQGTFRNAMIAEAESEYYFILDGDEYWPQTAIDTLESSFQDYHVSKRPYGLVRRLEVTHDLSQVHGRNEFVKHHRLYHRTATFVGPHPGEDPRYQQTTEREFKFPVEAFCYHFHQPARSSKDEGVPSRLSRRFKPTYVRGNLTPFSVIAEIPAMRKPINDFPVNPFLRIRQNG